MPRTSAFVDPKNALVDIGCPQAIASPLPLAHNAAIFRQETFMNIAPSLRWLMASTALIGCTAANAAPGRLPAGVTPLAYDISVKADADRLIFSGMETVQIAIARPVSRLTLNAVDINVASAKLENGEVGKVSSSATDQTMTFTFAKPLAVGTHSLSLTYTGKIYRSAAGLFAIDYDGKNGKQRMLITQFEAPDARRFAPMWDEPGFKTSFKLSSFAPDGLTALSNMPVASTEKAPGGTVYHFQTTPKMSSYLLFLGIGDIERKTVKQGETEIGIVTRRGVADQGDYALASAQKLLAYYNDYFGTPYPLPKLDMIAAPGSSQFFGAMENWGGILYFERTVLIDPKLVTESQRQNVFDTVAHEMAHQWFGDLVTMSWWDDLWLNEGYASWMASKAANDLNPDWHALSQSVAFARQGAFSQDAHSTTHPIIQHIRTADETSQAFDNITYRKGEAIIRMLESYVGPDAFRAGVRRYMAKHAYGNTVTDQLWAEIAATSGKPITPIMHSFTLQAGVPMIRVGEPRCVGGKSALTLTQDRFGLDAPSRVSTRWIVPVTLAAGSDSTKLEMSGTKPITARLGSCGLAVVNAGQGGYFRTLYAPRHFDALMKGFGTLSRDDQIGLMADSLALATGSYTSFDRPLDLIAAAPADASPLLWNMTAGRLSGFDDILTGTPQQAAFRARAAAILAPLFVKLGWDAKPGEATDVAQLRETLIPIVGKFGNAEVVADARRFAEASFAADSAVTGAKRIAALDISAYLADGAQWDALHARAKAETSPVAREQLYRLLGGVQDEALAKRALAIALTDEAPVPMRASIISSVGGEHPERAFEWAVAHADAVNNLIEASARPGFIVGLASESAELATADRVNAYASKALAPDARKGANETIARIKYLADLRRRLIPASAIWAARR
jgi:aminopeptidase N